MKYISRIHFDLPRCLLLLLLFPIEWLLYILLAFMPVVVGGHPNKYRLLESDFYLAPWGLFWAAWDGYFVSD